MPKMGGIQFYSIISKNPVYSVLVLTARANLAELFKDLDVDGFMTKPFEVDDLLNEVSVILQQRDNPSSMPKATADTGKPKKILIIEDDEESINRMVAAFANEGFIVNTANTGASGIERVKTDRPDVVLVKMNLPDLTGDRVTATLKKMPVTMDVPVVLYVPLFDSLDRSIINRICSNAGVDIIEESDDPISLIMACKKVLLIT